jgi:UDP-N-acetylmuramoyl-L-alanyl-D-glutamate--2,6-diaminopimelate ligase
VAIRPASRPQRPLSALSTLLGVRLVAAGNSMPPNELGFLSGLTLDSRSVKPGDLYVALPGARVHGAAFCADAVAAGAVAVLTDPGRPGARGGQRRAGVRARRPARQAGRDRLLGVRRPVGPARLIGVTGTSGKTTSTYLIEAGLRAAGHKTGLVGGVELRVGDECLASSLTTPEAPTCRRCSRSWWSAG